MIVKPLIKNYVVYQGTTFMLSFIWDIPLYTLTPTCKVAMQARSDFSSIDSYFDATTENGYITIDIPTQRIDVKIPATETSGFTFTNAIYDIEVEFDNGDRFRTMQGKLALNLEVTKI